MKSFRIILLPFFLLNIMLNAQTNQDSLIGMINKKMIHINRNDGGSTFYQDITNIPLSENPYRLTWSEFDQCFYTVSKSTTGGGYFLDKITSDGIYTSLGNISIPGDNVDMIEGLSFNRFDNELYASVSVNGTPPTDYWSERLLRIDIPTLTGTLLGTFNHVSPYEAEADFFAFDDNGMMYYLDGQPGGAGFVKIFRQDVLFVSPAQLIYNSGFDLISDFTIKDDVLYFVINTSLKQIDLNTDVFSTVGTMFSGGSYNGESIRGLTWKTETCSPLDIVPSDTIFCTGDNVVIDANIGLDWTYLWSTGDTTSDHSINSIGIYDVIITNNNGTCIHYDTVNVTEQLLPIISAGINDTICLGSSVQLNGNGAGVLGSYLWSNGVTDSVSFEPFLSADYSVEGTDSLGCLNTNTVHIEVLIPGNPEFDYGTNSWCYSDADVLPIIGSADGQFSSTPIGLNLNAINGLLSPQNSLIGTYDITYSLGGDCPMDSILSISINAGPTIIPLNDVVYCEGELFLDVVFSINPNLIINWENSNSTYGLQLSGTGTIPAFNIEEVNSNQISTLIYTPNVGTCIGEVDTFLIQIKNKPTAIVSDYQACFNDSVLVLINNIDNANLTVSPNVLNNEYVIVTNDQTYNLIANLNGCSSNYQFDIALLNSPDASFILNETLLDINEFIYSFNLNNQTQTIQNYQWNFGDGYSSQEMMPVHNFDGENGQIFEINLTVQNEFGCVDSAISYLSLEEELIYYIPNAITIDGNSLNNVFRPVFSSGLDIYDYHLVIYNRWGEILFESFNAEVGWNGKFLNSSVMDGVYVWKIDFGLSENDKRQVITGHVTVIK